MKRNFVHVEIDKLLDHSDLDHKVTIHITMFIWKKRVKIRTMIHS